MTETVKGFKEFSGEEARKRKKIKEILIKNFERYGFEPAETPIIEQEKFLKKGAGQEEVISDIFRLRDKGKRNLALRYEFTFQLKRLARGKKLPYKRYQIGYVFRDEPTKKGRYRQFTQADIDIIGSSEIVADAELLALTKKIFEELKIPVTIQLNNRQLLNAIVENVGVRDKKTQTSVIKEIDKLEKDRERAYSNLKKLLGEEGTEKLLEYFNKSLNFFIQQEFPGASDIKELKKLCKVYDVGTKFQPSLARGLLYYTGNVFEIKSSGYRLTLAGGGRYDVDGLSSIGISFGLDRIAEVSGIKPEVGGVLILSIGQDEKAIKLAENLRMGGISCSVMYGKPTKALQYANSYKIPYVVFVGEKEVKKKKFKLRDMKTGKESLVSEKELVKKIL